MKRFHAFALAFLVTLFLFSNFYLIRSISSKEYHIISRVIDGDTFVLENQETVRLANINAPEKSESQSTLSIDYLKSFENRSIEMESLGKDKYGRTLARVYTPNYINLELVKQGLVKKFLVDKTELKTFSDAESQAVTNEKGIWQFSQYKSCISMDLNPQEEIVVINNFCHLNLDNWYIEDESRKQFFFSSMSPSKITVHSREGKNNQTDLYWNSKQDIWNNDRDTLYLFDTQNKLAGYYVYGY